MTISQAIAAALAHHRAGRLDEAEQLYQAVLRADARNFNALQLLGAIAIGRGDPDSAVQYLRRAIEVNPHVAEVHANLGMALQACGNIDEAIASYDRAIAVNPDFTVAWNNKIYAMQFQSGIDSAAIYREQRLWSERFEKPLKSEIIPHANLRDPDRKLRIGYLSPHFRSQAESFFIVPILRHHDRENFEVHCYSSALNPDTITTMHRQHADQWHEVHHLDDRALAEKIRVDGIDILVDLTMHMSGNRLLTFARKPAPIQVTYLAYPGGTGLDAMDYRLTDRWLDPPGYLDAHFSEKPFDSGGCWCCYDPLIDLPPAAPRSDSQICFGSLNNPCKLNSNTVSLWMRLLLAVPDSRLLLLSDAKSQQVEICRIANAEGVNPGRIQFVRRQKRDAYLRLYDDINAVLDPLPYNGITTTLDALWMGVPVISLIGDRPAGRAGLSLLSQVGLSHLVAGSADEFVRIGAALAGGRGQLQQLRTTLRDRLKSSDLMNAPVFTKRLELVYRRMWQNYVL